MNDNHQAFVSGKIRECHQSISPHTFSVKSNLEGSVCAFFFSTDNYVVTVTYEPRLWHTLGFRFRLPYLLHCPCCQCTGSPWLHHSLLLSTLAGKHNASHFGPVYTSHCCCTNRGNPLSRQGRRRNSDLSFESLCT